MCTARLLFCAAWSLSFVSVTGAAFERALFPQPPLDTISRVTTNPASLADVHRPCGGVGHDRPFGLQALSGHRVLLAVAPATGSRNGTGRRSPWPAATSGVRGVAWSGHAGLRFPRCGGGRAAAGLAGRGGSFAGRRVALGAARSMVLGRLGPTGHRHRTRPRLAPPEAERLEWRRHRQPVGACRPTHNSVAVHGDPPESKALPVRPGPLACPRFSRQRDAVKRTPRPPGGCRHAPGAWFLSRRVGGPNLSIGLPTLGTVAMFEG